ncbi:unnamed protein product [Rhodiola kirilowii]
MSTMKFNRKPPLAKSPVRTRPRRALRSTTSMSVQTPPGLFEMSTMKFNRKPPLAKSPVRTRPRPALRSTTSMSVQTPPGSLTKSSAPLRRWDVEEIDLRPEFRSTSCELRALARMATSNIESGDKKAGLGLSPVAAANKSPLFERGRFYDIYSARRNDRLKRKLGMEMEDDESFKKCNSDYDLGVTIGQTKRRDSKRLESGRKSIAVDFLVDRSQHLRYSLRSSTKENKKPPLSVSASFGTKENKKPPLSFSASFDNSYGVCVDAGGKKTLTSRRVARKI